MQFLFRFIKITGIALAIILLFLFFAPYLFPDTVSRQIKQWTNQSIKGELNFSKARLSFFSHFPSLTLTLYDVDLNGSAPFEKDTLLSATRLGFGVDLKKIIFNHQVNVNTIYLHGAYIHVLVNEKGEANYNIYDSDSSAKKSDGSDSTASLHLEKIIIKDSRLRYNDHSIPMVIEADHLNYEGSGDLSKSEFDLASHITTDSLSFIFDKKQYAKRKAIDARMVTLVNTKTLALIFENNQVRMNKLNLAFSGRLDFLKNGYDMDFNLNTQQADLYQLITILPPEYLDWLKKTTVKGDIDLHTTLKGKYIASTNQMPDYAIKLRIRDGFISYQDAKLPITGLQGYTSIELPSLDPEKIHVKIDSLSFHLNQDFFNAMFESTGLSEPEIKGNVHAQMDLQNLKKALGVSDFDMMGQLSLQFVTKGKYSKKIVQRSLRVKDTVIATIPSFDLQCNLKNGFIKYFKVAQPVTGIFLTMKAACPDADYHHAYFKIDSLHAAALNNYIQGKAVFHASADFPMDADLKGSIRLGDISQIYPLDSLSLSGMLHFDVQTKGKYAPDHHLFPKTNALFQLKDGNIQTKYYPHPIEKIQIEASASDASGNLNGLDFSISKSSLLFEGKAFHFNGRFKNFDDLIYEISVNGELDLDRIYQVFARKDMGLTGFISAHADFKGKQSDATNRRYDLLKNSGTMEIRDMRVTHELFPKPFFIHHGQFRFDQDKMWFDHFQAEYGKSDMQMDGFVENAINYVLGKKETLKANFNLKSNNINLNEFAVYASSAPVQSVETTVPGVIMIPENLDLSVKATVEKVLYNDIVLNHFLGSMHIIQGEIELSETGFELIGCQVGMKGKYASISPLRAGFEYQLQAKDFDVHRAYKEIKLFHDLASSAEHASGIISLDYSLSGKLNERMYPVYPSLKGGGVLSVKNVKFNGWKLFNNVSSQSGKTELKDPDLSKIEVKSSIKNNLITIEKMKFKTGGFRIRFEGQTSFDNQVNFKMRIGLPPLGIIGIPVRVTGKSDNPNIKITSSENDKLEEKEEE